MIGFQITSVDTAVLPAALLDLTKKHCRVDFTDDDDYIKICITRAIDIFERISGWRVNPTTADWWPVINNTAVAYQLPLQPAAGFKVMAGTDDVSADFRLRYVNEVAPFYLASIAGTPWPMTVSQVELTLGYDDVAKLPVAALDCVLRITATLYERRESVDAGSLDLLPGWENELISGIWIPRV